MTRPPTMRSNFEILLRLMLAWTVVGLVFGEALLAGCLWIRLLQKGTGFPSSLQEGLPMMTGGTVIALTAAWQWRRSRLLFCVVVAGLGSALAGAGAFVSASHWGWTKPTTSVAATIIH